MSHIICSLNPDNLEQSGGFDNFDLVIFQIIWTTISLFKHHVMLLYLRGRGSWGSVNSIVPPRFGVLFHIKFFRLKCSYRCQLFFLKKMLFCLLILIFLTVKSKPSSKIVFSILTEFDFSVIRNNLTDTLSTRGFFLACGGRKYLVSLRRLQERRSRKKGYNRHQRPRTQIL